MNTVKIRIKEFFALWKNYSFSYACYNILWWFCFYIHPPFCGKISTFAINKKTKWLDIYFKNNYHEIINKYLEKNWQTKEIESTHIWVFWGQGEENMPPLVKACYRQLTYYNDNVILLTNDNIKEYIDIPPIVYKKVSTGHVSWAHFSDITRNTLLARYGGLWLDATVWVRGKIPFDKLKNVEFFSANSKVPASSRAMRFWTSFDYNWSTWCMYSRVKGNRLFTFVAEMLTSIAEREKQWLDYVIQDYLIYYAYKELPDIADMLESCKTIPCCNRNKLAEIMNERFDEEKYNELIKDDFVFKLSFRTKWEKKTEKGEQTFYGRILEDII